MTALAASLRKAAVQCPLLGCCSLVCTVRRDICADLDKFRFHNTIVSGACRALALGNNERLQLTANFAARQLELPIDVALGLQPPPDLFDCQKLRIAREFKSALNRAGPCHYCTHSSGHAQERLIISYQSHPRGASHQSRKALLRKGSRHCLAGGRVDLIRRSRIDASAGNNQVEAPYRRGDLFNKRRQPMYAWSAHCASAAPISRASQCPALSALQPSNYRAMWSEIAENGRSKT